MPLMQKKKNGLNAQSAKHVELKIYKQIEKPFRIK